MKKIDNKSISQNKLLTMITNEAIKLNNGVRVERFNLTIKKNK